MKNKRLATSKNQYQCWLWTYTKRREKMREKYTDDIVYGVMSRNVAKKMKTIKKAIYRIEKKEQLLSSIREKTKDFCGVDVRKVKQVGKNQVDDYAKSSFIKYCMEMGAGLSGRFISQWLKNYNDYCSISRKSFTRSFKTNKEAHDFWNSYLSFMKQS